MVKDFTPVSGQFESVMQQQPRQRTGTSATFDVFLRSTFGIEPGSAIGRRLRELALPMSVAKGAIAPLDPSIPLLVYLVDGATKLVARASRDREQIVAFYFGGDIVCVPGGKTHGYVLSALRDSRLLVFPEKAFYDCAEQDPAMLRALLERMERALHRCRDKTVGLGRKNAQERLASFLVAMAERMEMREDGVCVLDLPMSRRDIGDSLGLTIETVSRQFGELRAQGLLQTDGRYRVKLPDLLALENLAGHYSEETGILDS